ncbi:MAG: hypothetical protein RL189_1589 [Pseudomonadota bacterium]|jgi:hypothetical protein
MNFELKPVSLRHFKKTSSSVLKISVFLGLAGLLVFSVGCKKTSTVETQATQGSLNSRKKTACVSFQGNGVYYSAHVGALISILENNYEPVFASGGSSGAIIASVARALVENPSLRGSDGTFAPQKAATILASSSSVIESFLFLPLFTNPLKMLDALDGFFSSSAQGFINGALKDALVHAESVVGQATLVVDFFRTADFEVVLREKSLIQRELKIAALWSQSTGAIRVKPDQIADALFTPRKVLLSAKSDHLVEIQDRLFRLYKARYEDPLSNHKVAQETWNEFIEGNYELLSLNKPETRRLIFRNFIQATRSIESFDSLAAAMSGDVLLADPKRVFHAANGIDSRKGKKIEIPSNVVIHTTARRASKTADGWKEHKGVESLYQFYVSNSRDLKRNASVLLKPENNPLQPKDKSKLPVIPSERLAATTLPLGPALAATTGEVSAFERTPLTVDTATRNRFKWHSAEEQFIGFGGWLEKLPIGTLARFKECSPQNVDIYFYTSDGVAVNSFAKMIFTGLYMDFPLRGLIAQQIRNPTADLGALLSGDSKPSQTVEMPPETRNKIDSSLSSIEAIFEDWREAKARKGVLPVNFLFAQPAKMGGHDSQELNIEYRSNRRAMMLAVYEFTRKVLRDKNLGTAQLPLWSNPLNSILEKKTRDEVLSIISGVMPRPTWSEQ